MKNAKVYYIEILVIYQVLFAISLQGSRTVGFLLGLFPNLKQVIALTLPDKTSLIPSDPCRVTMVVCYLSAYHYPLSR